jgi:hypothetical protein
VRDADSVRYIVLRKLASGLRHTLLGELQSIQFFAELAGRLMDKGSEEAKMRECVGKLPGASQAAVATCRSVIEWLRPEEGATTPVGEALTQCFRLVADDWSMRGIVATIDVAAGAGEAVVSRSALRELIVTSLLALSDAHPGPLDIRAGALLNDGDVLLQFSSSPANRSAILSSPPVYHALTYADLSILAADHGVPCSCGDDAVALRLARMPAGA